MDAVEEKGLKEIRTSLTVPLTSAIVRLEHIDKSVSDADEFRKIRSARGRAVPTHYDSTRGIIRRAYAHRMGR